MTPEPLAIETDRFVTLHAHFYQPPRENPWLEEVEVEPGAAPYHDWNERIATECYAPNTAARRVDGNNRILNIVNNFEKVSFNVSPTLLAWLERHLPDTYGRVLEADRRSAAARGGHGNAIAQVYNHVIMPLATPTDKVTEVRWGIEDFRRRFGRLPEGMWLPETAVDRETLDVLAAAGLRFTILAPSQARRVQPLAGGPWKDVGGERIDPTQPYLYRHAPAYRYTWDDSRRLIRDCRESGTPVPEVLTAVARQVLQQKVVHELTASIPAGRVSERALEDILEARALGLTLDLTEAAARFTEAIAGGLATLTPDAPREEVERLRGLVEGADQLGLRLRRWRIQNQFFALWCRERSLRESLLPLARPLGFEPQALGAL